MTPSSSETFVTATASDAERSVLRRAPGKFQRSFRRGLAFAERLARQRPFLFAISLVSLLFTAVILIMTPAFQTNDDAIMCMIASGQGIALSPDEHLVFTNAIIGNLLKTLYTEIPSFQWYGWYLVATQWFATIAILYCLLRPRYTRLSMLGFGAYFFTAGMYFLVNLQFTATGSLAGIAGGLLLMQLLRHSWQSRLEQAVLACAAVLFLVWGGLIRSDTFQLAMIISCPVLIATYWASSASRGTAVKVGLSLATATGLMFLAGRYHESCYSDPSWVAFYEYNAVRIKFNDEQWVNYSPETKHVFDAVGWSHSDFEIMQSWFYDDPPYEKENLSAIMNGYSWARERNLPRTLRLSLKEVFRHTPFAAMLFVMQGLLLFLNRRHRNFWAFAVSMVTAWGMVLAITLFRKAPPERVFMPVLTFPWLVAVFTLAPGWCNAVCRRGAIKRMLLAFRTAWQVRHWSWLKPGGGKYLALRTISLLVVVGVYMSIWKQIRSGMQHTTQAAEYKTILHEMRPAANESECLVITFGADFPYDYQTVLFGKNDYSGLRFFCLGWTQRTPIAERMKQHFQIKTLGQAIATNPNLRLLIHPSAYMVLIDYLAEHYSNELRIVSQKAYYRFALSRIEPVSTAAAKLEPSTKNPNWLAIPTLKRLGLMR